MRRFFKALLLAAAVMAFIGAQPCYAANDAGDTTEKMIALTFDDGPHSKYTPMILDILKRCHAHATFFLVGERAEQYPDIVARTFEEGHTLGNHTYDHTELTQLSDRDILTQIGKTNGVIERITGTRPVLLRPPLGGRSSRIDRLIRNQNMCTILWNVDPRDWYDRDARRITNAVTNVAKDGDIVILHDFYQNTVSATEKILNALQPRGYRFVTVDELLGEHTTGEIYYSRSLLRG